LNAAIQPGSKPFPPRKDYARSAVQLSPASKTSTSLIDCRENDMERRNGDEGRGIEPVDRMSQPFRASNMLSTLARRYLKK
jgi:hypothetical protein